MDRGVWFAGFFAMLRGSLGWGRPTSDRTVFGVIVSVSWGFGMFFFFKAEDGIRDKLVIGVQTWALPISYRPVRRRPALLRPDRADRAHPPVPPRQARPPAPAGGHGGVRPRRRRPPRRGRAGAGRSEERRVGKSVDLGGRRIIKKKKREKA